MGVSPKDGHVVSMSIESKASLQLRCCELIRSKRRTSKAAAAGEAIRSHSIIHCISQRERERSCLLCGCCCCMLSGVGVRGVLSKSGGGRGVGEGGSGVECMVIDAKKQQKERERGVK